MCIKILGSLVNKQNRTDKININFEVAPNHKRILWQDASMLLRSWNRIKDNNNSLTTHNLHANHMHISRSPLENSIAWITEVAVLSASVERLSQFIVQLLHASLEGGDTAWCLCAVMNRNVLICPQKGKLWYPFPAITEPTRNRYAPLSKGIHSDKYLSRWAGGREGGGISPFSIM